jgi:BCCT family betaine/carnitine transporter
MDKPTPNLKGAPIDKIIFYPSLVLVAVVAIVMSFFPDVAGRGVDSAYAFVLKNLSSMFMLFGLACFLILGWLSVSRYGNVKLGGPDEEPEFSTFSWISMLFCAGVGIGLMIWSLVEPIYYIQGPPMASNP